MVSITPPPAWQPTGDTTQTSQAMAMSMQQWVANLLPQIQNIDQQLGNLLPVDGSVPMTGELKLPANPTDALGAATKQYVDAAVAGVPTYTPPAGQLTMFAGSSAPTGWLICDGSAVSRSTYASLFGVIGTTWGAGDGSTTFNLPDLRGRAPIGAGTGSGLTARSLAATGGEEGHTLSSGEMPSHTHTFSGTTGTESAAHSHGLTGTDGNGTVFGADLVLHSSLSQVGAVNVSDISTATESASHTHSYSGTTSSAGSGSSHNNMQPFAVVNFIIKT